MATQLTRKTAYGLSDPILNVSDAPIVAKRDPTTKDRASIGAEWVNNTTNTAFILTSIEDNVSNWEVITNSADVIQFDTDSGNALPAAGIININGANGITTSGSGNSIVITGGTSIQTIDGDIGTGVSGSTINIVTGYHDDTSTVPLPQGTPHFSGDGISTLTLIMNDPGENIGLGANSLANIAVGSGGVSNIAIGFQSGQSLVGGNGNVFIGTDAGVDNVSGISNTGIGVSALDSLSGGTANIALGNLSGNQLSSTESSNIYFNSHGVAAESHTLRIGQATGSSLQNLSAAYICGIQGVNVGSVATVVSINGDQLGTTTITPGSGITVTPGSGTITIAASGGSAITTIDGNSGSATGSTVTITTGSSNASGTAKFTGSGSTVTFTASDTNFNTAFGLNSLAAGGAGGFNTCYGQISGQGITSGLLNTCIGYNSGAAINGGSENTFLGAVTNCSIAGSRNIAIGYQAGNSLGGSENDNILISSLGVSSVSNVLRIGRGTGTGSFQLNSAFISGIQGINVGSVASVVSINGDQLGTTTITAGSNITVTPGAGTITIAATGGGGGVTQLDGNTGFAVPIAGVIHVETSTGEGTSRFTGSGGGTLILGFGDSNDNTGIGGNVLAGLTSGTNNTGFGRGAIESVSTGTHNTAFGVDTLDVTSGSYNTAVGFDAGSAYTSTESSNVVINSTGTVSESNVLRIGSGTGTGNQQLNSAFISGIQTITVTGTAVLVSSSDQLGVAVSSRRFKSDIQDMRDDSDVIYNLRPVTFHWDRNSAPGLSDAPADRQFGLIAEEVAERFPQIVTFEKNGTPLNVNYGDLIAPLLNEVQKLRKYCYLLEERLEHLENRLGV